MKNNEAIEKINIDYINRAVAGIIYDALIHFKYKHNNKMIRHVDTECKPLNIIEEQYVLCHQLKATMGFSPIQYYIEIDDNQDKVKLKAGSENISFSNEMVIHPFSACLLLEEDNLIVPQLEPLFFIPLMKKILHFFDLHDQVEKDEVERYFSHRGNQTISRYNHQYRTATFIQQNLIELDKTGPLLDNYHFPSNGTVTTPDKDGNIHLTFRAKSKNHANKTNWIFVLHNSVLDHYIYHNEYCSIYPNTQLLQFETDARLAGEEVKDSLLDKLKQLSEE